MEENALVRSDLLYVQYWLSMLLNAMCGKKPQTQHHPRNSITCGETWWLLHHAVVMLFFRKDAAKYWLILEENLLEVEKD